MQGSCYCAVNFPDSANGMKVSRMSVTFMDNNGSADLEILLYKMNRWTGNISIVAFLSSSSKTDSSSIQFMNVPKIGMYAHGIDNNRYSWF
jgi:hypothetical protein